VIVEFGPSRSKRFPKALTEAENGPGECHQLEPDRYRVSFTLGADAAAYTGLGRLLERVRHWRATEVYEDDEPVSVFHAKEMGWCASFQLTSFGDCRERFEYGVLPRCALCPLFDAERAIRAGIREEPVPGQRVQIGFGQGDFGLGPEPDFSKITDLDFLFNPDLLAQLDGQIPDWMDLSGLVPDFPPEWESPVMMNQRTDRRPLAKTLLAWVGAWLNRRWR
jgi:hypothetical protein